MVRESERHVLINLALASSTWNHEELEACQRVLNSGELTMGKEVEKFESEFASYIGTEHAVMFNSGSSANLGLVYALKYMRNSSIESGDEVIVPAVSWSTTYYPVSQAGFVLDFVDIDANTLNVSVDEIYQRVSDSTKAIFVVNLLGNPAPLTELAAFAEEKGILLLEDNCESLGAAINGKRTGSFGFAGTHSFFYSHHICTMEGGMVTTNSRELAETMKSIRAHGWLRGLSRNNAVYPLSDDSWEDQFKFVLPGFNLRPLELSGAIGQVQLRKFFDFRENRRLNAAHFQKLFQDSPFFSVQLENGESSWFGFALTLKEPLHGKRREIIEQMKLVGVETRPIVAGNFLRNPVMKHLNYKANGYFNNADKIHENGFFFGNHHFDVRDRLDLIYKHLHDFASEHLKA